MTRIRPCLWFSDQAELAAFYYASIFRHSRVGAITHYGDAGAQASGQPKGSVMTVEFELDGLPLLALNGGPAFKLTEAISMSVACKDQKEIDYYWQKLSAGGQEGPCGWLKDRFGLSWQIVPAELQDMLKHEDVERTERVMSALLQMKKLDVSALERAFHGG